MHELTYKVVNNLGGLHCSAPSKETDQIITGYLKEKAEEIKTLHGNPQDDYFFDKILGLPPDTSKKDDIMKKFDSLREDIENWVDGKEYCGIKKTPRNTLSV